MSEENTKTAKQTLTESITSDMFMEYIDRFGFSRDEVHCPVCNGVDYNIPYLSDDEGIKRPVPVTTPVVSEKGKGVWSFMVICKTCAHTFYFNAPLVTDKLREEGKL